MNIKKLVDRFLGWPLPKSFAPDCGISFDGRCPDGMGYPKTWPVGTNLLTADEARQMFEYALADVADQPSALEFRLFRTEHEWRGKMQQSYHFSDDPLLLPVGEYFIIAKGKRP